MPNFKNLAYLSLHKSYEFYFSIERNSRWVTHGNVKLKKHKVRIEENNFELYYPLEEIPNLITLNISNSRKRLRFWVENESIQIIGTKEDFN